MDPLARSNLFRRQQELPDLKAYDINFKYCVSTCFRPSLHGVLLGTFTSQHVLVATNAMTRVVEIRNFTCLFKASQYTRQDNMSLFKILICWHFAAAFFSLNLIVFGVASRKAFASGCGGLLESRPGCFWRMDIQILGGRVLLGTPRGSGMKDQISEGQPCPSEERKITMWTTETAQLEITTASPWLTQHFWTTETNTLHKGTWGFSLGEAKQRNLYIS